MKRLLVILVLLAGCVEKGAVVPQVASPNVTASQPASTTQNAPAGRDSKPIGITAPITAVGGDWAIVALAAVISVAYIAGKIGYVVLAKAGKSVGNRWARGRR